MVAMVLSSCDPPSPSCPGFLHFYPLGPEGRVLGHRGAEWLGKLWAASENCDRLQVISELHFLRDDPAAYDLQEVLSPTLPQYFL